MYSIESTREILRARKPVSSRLFCRYLQAFCRRFNNCTTIPFALSSPFVVWKKSAERLDRFRGERNSSSSLDNRTLFVPRNTRRCLAPPFLPEMRNNASCAFCNLYLWRCFEIFLASYRFGSFLSRTVSRPFLAALIDFFSKKDDKFPAFQYRVVS